MTDTNVFALEQTKTMHALSILFWLKKQKTNALGKCPIICRITIRKLGRIDFSTGHQIEPCNWSAKFQSSTNQLVNIYLDVLLKKINNRYIDLFL